VLGGRDRWASTKELPFELTNIFTLIEIGLEEKRDLTQSKKRFSIIFNLYSELVIFIVNLFIILIILIIAYLKIVFIASTYNPKHVVINV
jgi:uncharacterized membrane protein